jgi:hypothetical protein
LSCEFAFRAAPATRARGIVAVRAKIFLKIEASRYDVPFADGP